MTCINVKIKCRACLCDEEELLKSFLDNPNILNMYTSCTSLQIEISDGLPMSICSVCINKCADWYSFKQVCTKNELILKNELNKYPSSKDVPAITNIEIGIPTVTNEIYIDEFIQNSDEEKPNIFNDKYDNLLQCQKDSLDNNMSIVSDLPNLSTEMNINNRQQSLLSIESTNPIYECIECGDKFKNKFMKNRHTRRRHPIKKFDCSECGKLFKNRAKLLRHTRTHTGEKPFKCTYCDKLFSSKDYIRIHMRSHTGEKPFLCTLCGKFFRQKSSLDLHFLTHTGEKPYACSQCDKAYKTKSYLTAHILRSHQT